MKTLLIANRGEITCRIITTARRMGVRTVAVYSAADARAKHVAMADEAVFIGPAPSSESYLNIERIIHAAEIAGADAIHPGYGFLSENPELAEACVSAGITFVGPSARCMRAMGLKDAAKRLMEAAQVPVVPGYHGDLQDSAYLAEKAQQLGYPILIKARAGGGGKGMRKVSDADAFPAALQAAQREARASFGDPHVLIEKWISKPRHIEIQIFGDMQGNIVHLFERDCSLQRRHQKVIEEAPAPGMTDLVRDAMTRAALKAARAIDYVGAGTVEFIVDSSQGLRADGFWFMEMNTRLQVEHPVTEAVTGVDLVEWQLRIANGESLPLTQNELRLQGHAVEARLYAEHPGAGFLPASGRLQCVELSGLGRVDSGVVTGDEVPSFYDPLLAKLIAHAPTREQAFARLVQQLAQSTVLGIPSNREFLWQLLQHPAVLSANFDTSLIEQALDSLIEPSQRCELAAIACVALLDPVGESANAPLSLASRLGPWQLWGRVQRELRLEVNGSTMVFQVVLEGRENAIPMWQVHCCDLDAFPHNGIQVMRLGETKTRLNGIARETRLSVVGQQVHVQWGPWSDIFTHVRGDAQAGAKASSNNIQSPMPGRVVAIHCHVGDAVAAGQALLSVEAMKMEQELACDRDGIVEMIAVRIGDQVTQGMELLRLAKSE